MEIDSLDSWQKAILPRLRETSFRAPADDDVTLLAYFFWDDNRIETKFYTIECTFLCAFANLGLMKSVLVVNKTTPCMVSFCEKYNIKIDVDPSLTGGVPTMNVDCIKNLYKRFSTRYVLIIQSDGLAVNPYSLAQFKKNDYWGAPWPLGPWGIRYLRMMDYVVGNGGFTMRTHRICRCASIIHNLFFRWFKYGWYDIDDVFYALIVRFFCPFLSFPSSKKAAVFSIEDLVPYAPEEPPFGFHAEKGFQSYLGRYGMPMKQFLEAK